MAGLGAKATVTPLGSLFPAEEAQKAADRVQDAISDRRKELDGLHGFIADNSALIKLVRELPDDLSHEIMVPFGSAAFFPGRMIHTNEFLVLLGEGYYAERTAKQTVEILRRRGKALETQVDTLKATMLDLEAEAKFFGSTAAEAAEGLVEIREEYFEKPQISESGSGASELNSPSSSRANSLKMPAKDDEEHARMMAMLDKLEKEELEGGLEKEDRKAGADEDEEAKEYARIMARLDELEKEEHEAGSDVDEEADAGSSSPNPVSDDASETSEEDTPEKPVEKSKCQEMFHSAAGKPTGGGSHQHRADLSFTSDSNMQFETKESIKNNMEQSHATQKLPLPPHPKESLHKPKLEDSSDNVKSQFSTVGLSGRKAFTGSVIEHTRGLPDKESTKSSMPEEPSKPVSRFKMQRGNR